jgi:hypothetical protein
MNLLIALSTQGLIGAAFPTTGIPEIPKPRLTHLDPAMHNVGGNGSGMNAGASLKPAGGVDERMNQQWSGTLTWQGTDATSNERKEVCTQVTAIASKGNPCAFMIFLFGDDLFTHIFRLASTWPNVLPLAPAGPAVSMDELYDWMRKHSPAVTHIEPTPGTDGHSCGQLVKLLKDKSCVGRFVLLNLVLSCYLTFLTVCCCGLEDPGRGPLYDEPSHSAILARPPWRSIPNHWDA